MKKTHRFRYFWWPLLLSVLVPALFALGPDTRDTRSRRRYPIHSQTMRIEVLDCNDGDTCRGRGSDGLLRRLRLLGIDAPEMSYSGQPHAREARDALNALVKGRVVDVTLLGADVYGRSLALLYGAERELLNERLLREGHGHAYRGPGVDPAIRAWSERAEAEARRARRGLWALPQVPEDPAHFRRRARSSPGPVRIWSEPS